MPRARIKSLMAPLALALVFAAGAQVRAQTPGDDDLRARIERLEKQNQELLDALRGLRQAPAAAVSVSPSSSVPGVTGAGIGDLLRKEDVHSIITEYMQAKDEEKKAKAPEKKDETKTPDGGYIVGSDPKLSVNWNRGLQFTSPNGDYKVHVGGRLQQHNWFFTQDQNLLKAPPAGVGRLDDSIFFRRIRIETDGSAFDEVFEWDFDMDFSSADLFFQDAWFGITQLPIIGNFRAGHIKVPFSLESLGSSKILPFMERSALFDAFCQEFDPGFYIFNDYLDKHMTLHAALTRMDQAQNAAVFKDGAFEATARATFLPYYSDDGRCYLHLGAAYQIKEYLIGQNINQTQFRARPEWRSGLGASGPAGAAEGNNNRWVDTGVFNSDAVQQFGAELWLSLGEFHLAGEWIGARADSAKVGAKTVNPFFQGFYVQAGYFLTRGDYQPYDKRLGRIDRVVPLENFYLVRDHEGGLEAGRGAVQVLARYSYLDLNSEGINGGQLEEYTLGLNWFWSNSITWQFNYVHAHRNTPPPRISGEGHGLGVGFRYIF